MPRTTFARPTARIAALAFAAAALACGGDGGTGPGSGGTQQPPPPPPSSATIVMSNTQFMPQVDTVAVDATVTWRNDDPFDHNTTAENGAWASEDFGQGGTFEHTFTAAGTFAYSCTIHPGMTGTIVVR